MQRTVLVTGATGTLGRDVVAVLKERGHDVRGLSRSRPGYVHGDLLTGNGLAEALDGVDVVIHAATDGRKDVAAGRNLIAAAAKHRPHLIFVSIVGVDDIPLGYYRDKVAIEGMVKEHGATILRASQFHNLVLSLAKALTAVPLVGFYPAFDLQPVATRDVAVRLAELVEGDLHGGTEDFAGPQRRGAKDLWRAYLTRAGKRRLLVPLRLPGKIFRGYRSGAHTGPAKGTGTWEEHLERSL